MRLVFDHSHSVFFVSFLDVEGPLTITAMLTAGTFLLLDQLEIIVASIILGIICVVAPIWKFWLQGYKTTLRGPWDLAHISPS